MLKNQLLKGFAVIIIIFAALSLIVGVRIIKSRIIDEAHSRVMLDMSSAWAVYDSERRNLETVVKLVSSKEKILEVCDKGDWTNTDARLRLEKIKNNFGLDFLDLLSPEGQVMARSSSPYKTGDYLISNCAVEKARKGEAISGTILLSPEQMKLEADGMAEKAFIELEETSRSRKSSRKQEDRGMAIVCAVPVEKGNHLIGIIYGGILLNRNNAITEKIRDIVYKNQSYQGKALGTATLFLGDSRISTTVVQNNGNKAIGTKVSKEVADKVLDNGKEWIGDAYVLNEKYIAAYSPIRDCSDEIIGMLYVGILEKKFRDTATSVLMEFVIITVVVLLIGLVLSFIIASKIAGPLHMLVVASNKVVAGDEPSTVTEVKSCHEADMLVRAFNKMSETLAERQQKLRALNKRYMEMLGFVAHELKSPLAAVMNYVYLIKEKKLGDLTEKQEKAIKSIDGGLNRLVEMVRHYLDLSRIENNELELVKTRVALNQDVLIPLVESLMTDAANRSMKIINKCGDDAVILADVNLIREVFENLINNAIKYGKEGGEITISSVSDDGSWNISVKNEGEGIRQDRLGELFKKFSRLSDNESVKRQKGTGLGLFISKSIMDAHGGKISADSKYGEWVAFTISVHKFK